MSDWPLATRLARRELRGGLRGFRVFLACLILGVAAIASVGGVSNALILGLAEEGQALLGGDLNLRLTHRPVSNEERAWLDGNAANVSEISDMRAMARPTTGDATNRTLVELKSVDAAYPIYGAIELSPSQPLHELLAQTEGQWGAVVEPILLDRLGIEIGDQIRLGETDFLVRGVIDYEPDRVAGGMALGPRVMITRQALDETGLFTLGSLITFNYRVRLPDEASSNEDLEAWKKEATDTFPDAGWRIQDRTNGAPGIRRFIGQFTVFLTLVGLTALVVGGVGVGNAVRTYLDGKRNVIATLKCLGAPGDLIFKIYIVQVMALALVGVAVGLILGAIIPFAVAFFFGELLPIPARFGLYIEPLILAAAYGVLVALAFALWPIARARELPAASLFRDLIAPQRRWPRQSYLVGIALAFAALVGLAMMFSENRSFTFWFLIAAVISFVILMLAGRGLMVLASRYKGSPMTEVRLALANLYRPGAPTSAIVLSLGLGLTLLVTIALVDGNFQRQVLAEIPEKAPSFFLVDIQQDQVEAFDKTVLSVEGANSLDRVPSLRGQIKLLNGERADPDKVHPDARWALRGDRGVSYSRLPPGGGSTIVEGEWWPEDYQGPALVSFERELAVGLGVGVGDTMTVRVLGRDIKATIANLRDIDFSGAGLNFTIVLSPGALAGAPHTHLATLRVPRDQEETLQRLVAAQFPNITVVGVRETLNRLNGLMRDLVMAVRGASGVTLVAGILVLSGAMASGHRHRVYDAVVLKVLGATRRRVMLAYVLEYALLGFATAAIAAVLGSVAAYFVMTEVMEAPWTFLPYTLMATAIGATLVTIALGLAGTWRTLGSKAAPVLRAAQEQ